MPGKSKLDGSGQRKFIRNMAAAGALGASTGNVGAKLLTRGKSKFMPVRSAVGGAAAGGAVGTGMVVHHRKKVHKSMSTSAFGIDHGKEF